MKKSIFVIIFMGGEYEDHWSHNMKWCFTTHEKAEEHLFSKHYKKSTGWMSEGYYEPIQRDDDWLSNAPSMAKIEELNYWEFKK